MPSSYTLLTLDEIHGLLIASFAGWFPDDDVSAESDNWKRLRVLALAIEAEQHHLRVLYDDLLPDSATGVRLDRWGVVLNVPRKQATPAKKAKALRCTGQAGSTVTQGAQLTHADGTRYQIAATATIATGATFVDVDLVAVDTGSVTRKNKGEALTFSGGAPVGIDPHAELQLALDEDGDDIEKDGDYRVRVLAKIAQPGMGGNSNDYRAWAKEVAGVREAYVYSARGGLGSVHVAAVRSGSGAARALPATDRAAVKAYINARRPVSVADFLVLETLAEATDVEIRILPEDGDANRFDWDDIASPRTVASYAPATRLLTLSAPRPADMEIGDRLTWRSNAGAGSIHDGSEVVIEAFGGGADQVVLRAPLPGEYDWTATQPIAGNSVYSGGPLVAGIRAAVKGLIDSLGPARGAFAAGNWVGTLYTSQLFKIVQTTRGVLDSTIVLPLANATPSNVPPSPSVGFLVARQVLVRRA